VKDVRRFVTALILALGLLAACANGDGGADGGGGDGAQTVSAESYVRSICTSMQSFLTEVQDKSTDFTTNLDPTASLEEQKAGVVAFLDDIIASTAALIGQLEAAGVPDVDAGETVVAAMKDSFDQARAVLEQAKTQVQDLASDDPQAFAEELSAIGTSIQESLGEIGSSLDALDTPELSAAAEGEEACQAVAGLA
jgi:hypothetical protein